MKSRAVLKVTVFVMIILSGVFAQVTYAEQFVTTISAGNSPDAVAYDSDKGDIFVANNNISGTDTVFVISDSTNTVVSGSTMSVGNSPDALTYDSGKGEIFVANFVSNTVSVISDSTNTVVATISVGNTPIAVAYDSDKGEIFVANQGGNSVSVISDGTNTVPASGTHTGTATNGTNSPTAYVSGLSVPEFLMIAIAILAMIGAGIYLAVRYRKRAL